jgi:hydroxymethylpyrimidine pyrophosphatase-like HAD family hydrolase
MAESSERKAVGLMRHALRVIAVDYDGTIAESDRPDPDALAALGELRTRGYRVLLCTGRILDELLAVFPEVNRHFDAIVAENGAVLVHDGAIDTQERALAPELAASLAAARIPFRAGHVLLATDAAYDRTVLDCIHRHGLDAQLVYNRGALMVLPEGVTKGAGLLHALGRLELSRHSTLAIGDAENDHSMLQAAEIGVAVGNAVPALQAHADICLQDANGAAVAAFLRGPVTAGTIAVQPARWSVRLGTDADGGAVTIPGSPANVLIAGASCSGKSYTAGLFVERLTALDYTVCIFDAEGDHRDLEKLPGVLTVGGIEPLPAPDRLAALVRNRFSSVIADLSLLTVTEKRRYTADSLSALEALRRHRGYPHWIVLEEADQLLADASLPTQPDGGLAAGYCVVTHRPRVLHPDLMAALDAVIALPGAERYARIPSDAGPGEVSFTLPSGHALLATRSGVTEFRCDERLLRHVRHRHKYTHAQVPEERRFFFGAPGSSRASAGNLAEFRTELQRADVETLRQHLLAGDFSRWIRDVLADDELGRRIRAVERWFRTDPSSNAETSAAAVSNAIELRYSPGDEETSGQPRTTSTGQEAARSTA